MSGMTGNRYDAARQTRRPRIFRELGRWVCIDGMGHEGSGASPTGAWLALLQDRWAQQYSTIGVAQRLVRWWRGRSL